MKDLRHGIKKSIDTASDPYLNKVSLADNTSCGKCGAVYHKKRWCLAADAPIEKTERIIGGLCPACEKIRDGYVGGFVTLEGSFVKAHREEIKNLILNKEKRATSLNPLERIIKIRETEGGMEVTTTTEKFAQRLGAIIKKAYKGDLEYKWSADVKLVRVRWHRDS